MSFRKLLHAPHLSLIQKEVADFFRITIGELLILKPKIANLPRIVALYLSVKLTKKTYKEISSTMNNISASAISQAYDKIQRKLVFDEDLANTIAKLEHRICLKFQT